MAVGTACAASASTGRRTRERLFAKGADPLNSRPSAPPPRARLHPLPAPCARSVACMLCCHACMRCCSRVCPCVRSSAICPFAHVAPCNGAPCSAAHTRCCSHIPALLRTQCSPCVCRRSGQPGCCPRMRVCSDTLGLTNEG
ncbi:hypothetical protein T484DRAFT_1955276 [Baffinella frigidus]|nr:hypothetical protein T484DRAFT_1955276 [Cryptophyta sp. CCMP2293]